MISFHPVAYSPPSGLSSLNDAITTSVYTLSLSNGQSVEVRKTAGVCWMNYINQQNTAVNQITGQLPAGLYPNTVVDMQLSKSKIYINKTGAFQISAEGWSGVALSYIV